MLLGVILRQGRIFENTVEVGGAELKEGFDAGQMSYNEQYNIMRII
jgi:hypothetical protein